MGPDDSSATLMMAGWATKTRAQKHKYKQRAGAPRGLDNKDGSAEAPIQPATAEVARFSRPGMAPVAKNHRELSAGDDDDRHLPGH